MRSLTYQSSVLTGLFYLIWSNEVVLLILPVIPHNWAETPAQVFLKETQIIQEKNVYLINSVPFAFNVFSFFDPSQTIRYVEVLKVGVSGSNNFIIRDKFFFAEPYLQV